MYLIVVVLRIFEFVVAFEIGLMMVPLGDSIELHVPKRIKAFYFDDANSRCGMRVGDQQSIGRTSDDVVSELPEPGWFHYTSTRVLIRLNRHLLMIETALLGRDVLEILRSLDIIAEMLELG